jgi:hypothetical protein
LVFLDIAQGNSTSVALAEMERKSNVLFHRQPGTTGVSSSKYPFLTIADLRSSRHARLDTENPAFPLIWGTSFFQNV